MPGYPDLIFVCTPLRTGNARDRGVGLGYIEVELEPTAEGLQVMARPRVRIVTTFAISAN